MKIFNNETTDRKSIRQGLIEVNSLNVAPTTLVATAAGTLIPLNLIDQFDMFNVAQTSAGTDSIRIPNALPQGADLVFQATSAVSVGCPSGSSVLLNNVAAPAVIAVPANNTLRIFKASPTRIVAELVNTLGVISSPVPA